MAVRIVIVAVLAYFQNCGAMSSAEATFRCKTSIEKAEEISGQLKNNDLKRVAKIALSLMQENLEKILHGTLKDTPDMGQQCMQQAEHIAWLKNSIDPQIKEKANEKTSENVESSSPPLPSREKDKPSKKSRKKGKNVKIDQQKTLDTQILKKVLRRELNTNELNAPL